jgi:integrase
VKKKRVPETCHRHRVRFVARGRSAWGSVRRLPSGRYQARYSRDGTWRAAPTTFTTKRGADAFLAATRADVERGTWLDPEAGKIKLADYAKRWLAERPELRPRSREQYEILLRLHILPELGDLDLSKLSTSRVRSWHAGLLSAENLGTPTVAKCYRVLHAILATALEDELIVKNPCVLHGAATDRPAERPVASIQQVYALAQAIGPRYRLMVLLATFAGLRLGELRALRRSRIDISARTVHVVEQYQELSDGTLVLGPPKTDAGRRTVALPDVILPEIEAHLSDFAAPGKNGLVFSGGEDKPLNRKTFYRAWNHATESVGMTGFHFHDLRHTGNTLAAATGASTKELMARMGHSSPRAALIYQHATRDRDTAIAAGLSDLIAIATPTRLPVGNPERPRSKKARH